MTAYSLSNATVILFALTLKTSIDQFNVFLFSSKKIQIPDKSFRCSSSRENPLETIRTPKVVGVKVGGGDDVGSGGGVGGGGEVRR